MIKLIASDLDGTLLLHGSQQVSERAIELIKALKKYGIYFVAASGRQYPNLYRLFGSASEHMGFICENGAFVIMEGKIILKSCIDRFLGLALIDDIYQKDGCEVLLSGQNTSYIKPKNKAFADRMIHLVKNNVQLITNFSEVEEPFLKVSVFEESGIMEHSASYFINRWQNTFKCTVSGYGWLDFVNQNTNKGNALQTLLIHLSLTKEDALAFGDNFNDLEMLSLVKYPYVMDSADETIKKMYPYSTSMVEDTLERILKQFELSKNETS